jgi:hypothetical protein
VKSSVGAYMNSKRPVHIKAKSKINRERQIQKMSLDPYILKRPMTSYDNVEKGPPKLIPNRGKSSHTKYTMKEPAHLNSRE